jgi:nucleotidyltransferase substrate binding protein (TIGR01987 family)
MERLQQRITIAKQALATLDEALAMDLNTIVRDAAIQRFEFCVEAVWKLAQLYLRKKEGLDLGSPKQVLRNCFKVGLLDEYQTRIGLRMIDDRNLTVHTYDEELAEKIFNNLEEYAQLMHNLLNKIESR